MTGRQDEATPRSFAYDVLGGWLLLIAGVLFLPWAQGPHDTSFRMPEVLRMTAGWPTVAAVLIGVCAFLAFTQFIAASGLGLVAGLLAVLYGVDGVLGADRARLGTFDGTTVSISAWVVLLVGVGTLISSVAAFVVARRRFRRAVTRRVRSPRSRNPG